MRAFFFAASFGARALTISVVGALIVAPVAATTFAGCGGDDPPPPNAGVVPLPPAPEAGPVIDSRPVVCDDKELLPGDLRCTGLYADFNAKTIKPEAREFSPALSLWSDGAAKRRWLFLPPGTKIDTTNMDEWIFPAGTKVWKEFQVDGKLVETRLFAKKQDGEWGFATYEWSADATAALRLDSGKPNAVGTYEIPNSVHCSQCHNGHADRLLGVEAVLLGMPSAAGITLTSLKAEGLLSTPPAVTTITLPGDERTQKALGYLHVNCGIACHSPVAAGTSNFTGLHLRLSARQLLAGGPVLPAATDTFTTTIGKPFVSTQYLDDQRFVGFQRVIAKNPDKSLLLAVVQVNDTASMPPIVRHKVDDAGVQLLKDWILALP